MRRGLFAGGMLIAAVITGACSGGDDGGSDADASAPAAPSVTSGSASVPATSTVPPTTSTTAPPTTTSATTPPTSSEPPPPTDPPEPTLDELEAEVAAAYEVIYEGYWACLRAPLDCDTSWLAEGSGSAEAMQATMQGLADRDRYVGDDDVGYYVIEDIQFNDDRTEATVTSCWALTAVLYTTPLDPGRPSGPDNPPTVVNDTRGSLRQVDTLERMSGAWAVRDSQGIGEVVEEDVCSD